MEKAFSWQSEGPQYGYCKTCNQNKLIDLFPKGATILYKCKSCYAEEVRRKVACSICDKLISYSNISKHIMRVHGSGNPLKKEMVCDCGAIVCKYSYYNHLLTVKHKLRVPTKLDP